MLLEENDKSVLFGMILGIMFSFSAALLLGLFEEERFDERVQLEKRIAILEEKTSHIDKSCKQMALMGKTWLDDTDCTFPSRYYVDHFYKENYIINFD